jgi:hypothetical protein
MRVYAEPWYSGIKMHQKPTANIVINGLRTKLVFIDPNKLLLSIKVYDSADNLLVTTDRINSANFNNTQSYYYADVYFSISTPIHLSKNSLYKFELVVTGTQTSSKYVAWATDWPLPMYTGVTPTLNNPNTFPYSLAFMGDEL